MSKATAAGILVDAHVHIYDCFEINTLLDAASRNFNYAAEKLGLGNGFKAVLLLAETCRDNWFQRTREKSVQYQNSSAAANQWEIYRTLDKAVLQARKLSEVTGDEEYIFIMAGRQIVTSEGLELLALVTDSLFKDGLPTSSTLSAVREQEAIPVLPWAVGKWLGKRGRLLSLLLETEARTDLCLGDNSGRPVFWQNPVHFQQAKIKGMHLLPGTDPLRFAAEVGRIGSFGFMVRGELSDIRPSSDLKQLLRDNSSKMITYGHLESPLRFIINQIRLRIV
jgi:hypothetical protein